MTRFILIMLTLIALAAACAPVPGGCTITYSRGQVVGC